jgi:hypothetical protein
MTINELPKDSGIYDDNLPEDAMQVKSKVPTLKDGTELKEGTFVEDGFRAYHVSSFYWSKDESDYMICLDEIGIKKEELNEEYWHYPHAYNLDSIVYLRLDDMKDFETHKPDEPMTHAIGFYALANRINSISASFEKQAEQNQNPIISWDYDKRFNSVSSDQYSEKPTVIPPYAPPESNTSTQTRQTR